MGVSRTSRSLSQRQRNFANIYTHTGLARILKQGKINTKIDPKMAKLGKLPKIWKFGRVQLSFGTAVWESISHVTLLVYCTEPTVTV